MRRSASSTSPRVARAILSRTIITMSPPPRKRCCRRRNTSRTSRLARLRSTARLNSRRETTTPRRYPETLRGRSRSTRSCPKKLRPFSNTSSKSRRRRRCLRGKRKRCPSTVPKRVTSNSSPEQGHTADTVAEVSSDHDQTLPSFATSRRQNLPPSACGHPRSKANLALSFNVRRLICSLHRKLSPRGMGERSIHR